MRSIRPFYESQFKTLTKRGGETRSATVGWFWQIARNLMVTGEAAFTDNSSNIDLFDYERFKCQAGLRYQF
jgi:hypothetical protein